LAASSLDAGAGSDLLYGDAGNDSFAAKDGARDTLVGGGGKDRATVDKGKDVASGVEKSLSLTRFCRCVNTKSATIDSARTARPPSCRLEVGRGLQVRVDR
jgi:Ca2+-binding RTX toxin-like protein